MKIIEIKKEMKRIIKTNYLIKLLIMKLFCKFLTFVLNLLCAFINYIIFVKYICDFFNYYIYIKDNFNL